MNDERKRTTYDERAADERYRAALRRDTARARRAPVHGPANTQWTGSGVPRTPGQPTEGLVGRVALHHESDLVEGSEFYIGPRFLEDDGLTVFSWAAPIASTFFGNGDHELCPDVAVTRTLISGRGQIVDYVDEQVSGPPLSVPFAPRVLALPKAPARRPIRARTAPRTVAPPVSPTSEAPPRAESVLRAERAVHAALSAPRRDRLSSVLATMQPDQYDLVTRDPVRPLVIQGHPGTGKTIVAAHRAAYLVDKHAGDRRRRRVLVVGPTEHYVKHIKGVLTELADPGTVQATSLPEILWKLRHLPDSTDESLPTNYRDVDGELGDLAEKATHLLRTARLLPAKHAEGVAAVYNALHRNRAGAHLVTGDHGWAAYLTALPPLAEARRMRRFLPLLARCALAVGPLHTERFDHVIVDEAQDVTALEWTLLRELNAGDSWTLLGDINQRRCDWSCHSWQQVADALELPGTQALQVEHIDRGYRTTSEIMQFAGRLLPRGQRTVRSLQAGGVPPRTEPAKAADLYTRAASEALRLVDDHSEGTVAIIGMDRRESARALRRRGFTTDPDDRRRLVDGTRRIWVLDAHEARGLEFDAVVVVEPAVFPAGLGRHGLLYTSLTRANRELVVMHSAPLPAALRGHRSTGNRKAS